jgi:hypothetical protein
MCSKHDGRRSSRHAPWYASLAAGVAKRKDHNVERSSHGKYRTVAELRKAHPSLPSRVIPRERIIVQNNWLTKDEWR